MDQRQTARPVSHITAGCNLATARYSPVTDAGNYINRLFGGQTRTQKRKHVTKKQKTGLISGFCRNVDEICALLGYYRASCGNCLQTFWDNVSVPSSSVKLSFQLGLLTLEDGTNTLSRNIGKTITK
jgi:hypothetical protein